MMKAVEFNKYGGPDVLHIVEIETPHAGPGKVRIRVRGAAGGVGSTIIQLARLPCITVIGTASAPKHDYLRELGAVPTTYGEGLEERVRALAPCGIDVAIDVAGSGIIPELIWIVGDPEHVVSAADFSAEQYGAKFSHGSSIDPARLFAEMAKLCSAGSFTLRIDQAFPRDRAREAQEVSQSGRVTGKVVVCVG